MKRFLACILAVVFLLCCTGCGNGIPEGFTEEVYEVGKNILDTVDSYLDGEFNDDEAEEKIERFYDILDTYEAKYENDNKTSTNILSLQSFCLSLVYNIGKTSAENMSHIIDTRDSLAEMLGL